VSAIANRSNEVKEILKDILEPQPEVHYEHKWLFVIIPVSESYHDGIVPDTEALLAAYCKHCDSYYTKTLVWTAGSAIDGHAGLPRWGCIGPEGRF
jgi:hypothetical protein